MIFVHYIRLVKDYFRGMISLFVYRVLYGPWGTKIKFKGIPSLQIRKGAKLFIGNNVQLNSTSTFYHLNLFAPVKIILNSSSAKITIGANSRIHGSLLHAKSSIKIGEACLIAANCQIFDNNGHALSMRNPANRLTLKDTPKDIVIEDNVWLGTGVIVLPGTYIGEGTIVSANSVVKGVLKPNSIYAGNPATCIS
jgi:acetyltransferase-like isoleucine patch superfamily enzyme